MNRSALMFLVVVDRFGAVQTRADSIQGYCTNTNIYLRLGFFSIVVKRKNVPRDSYIILRAIRYL